MTNGQDDNEKNEIEKIILSKINETNEINDSWYFSINENLDHGMVVGVIKSLLVDAFLIAKEISTSFWILQEEANDFLLNGSPEINIFNLIPKEGILLNDLKKKVTNNIFKIGQGTCLKNKWIQLNKTDGKLYKNIESVDDDVTKLLIKIKEENGLLNCISDEDAKMLKKRKLISLQTHKSYNVTKGINFQLERKRQASSLTKEMIENGNWKNEVFKPYNFNTLGLPVGGGHLHPLMKVRTEFRRVLMDMGFEEMQTNRYVENSFWNFDALFQPQSHPARDAHDTFFLTNPATCNTIPEDYYEKVKDMHENGGYGSIGHGKNTFTREEACKNLLRTHTTAISAQMLYKLANRERGFEPKKYFSIDRVFRNENMDATHLAEFHQVEGVVADYDLSLGDLIGIINCFFNKIGLKDIRFKPAYNPYTEPSMEIFAFHPDLKKWTEIGNSGIFRPEMLLPMGLPPNVRVIAWGLSLERPTMIKYRLSNIRDLFGHKVDLEQTRTAKLYRI